jgi:hypothetical protein
MEIQNKKDEIETFVKEEYLGRQVLLKDGLKGTVTGWSNVLKDIMVFPDNEIRVVPVSNAHKMIKAQHEEAKQKYEQQKSLGIGIAVMIVVLSVIGAMVTGHFEYAIFGIIAAVMVYLIVAYQRREEQMIPKLLMFHDDIPFILKVEIDGKLYDVKTTDIVAVESKKDDITIKPDQKVKAEMEGNPKSCPECAYKLEDNQKFCPECGIKLR